MDEPPKPCYDLDQIKYLLRVRQFDITIEAERTAEALGFVEDDVYDCVRDLTPFKLYKSMPAEDPRYKGYMQDVYHAEIQGKQVYVKLQMLSEDFFRVISFKEKKGK
jgi:hypothetical protein